MVSIKTLWFALATLVILGCAPPRPAQAQTLEKSRTVYRCEQQGKIAYSDEPCVGAREVDVTPTQGLDKSSGISRKGADVQRAERDKAWADALKPITGLDQQGLEQSGRRIQSLTPEAQRACRQLDQQLPLLKAAEAKAVTEPTRAEAEVNLFRARKAFRDLRC